MPTVIRLSYCLRALIDLDSDNEVSRSRACIVDAVQKDYIMWKKNRRSSAAAPQLTQMKMKAKPSLEKSTMLFNHLSLVLTSTTVIIRSSGTPPPPPAAPPPLLGWRLEEQEVWYKAKYNHICHSHTSHSTLYL